MKYVYVCFFSLFLYQVSIAQSRLNALKLGVSLSNTPYESVKAFGAELQADIHLASRFTAIASVGIIQGSPVYSGTAKGSDQSGSWDNSYSFSEKERFSHIDAGLAYSFFKPERAADFRLGAGISYTHTLFHYPLIVHINKGLIENIVYTDFKADVLMANLLLEYQYKITNRLLVYAKGVARSSFREKHVLIREITYSPGASSTESGILNNFSVTAGLGYCF